MKTQRMTQVQLKKDVVKMSFIFILLCSFNFTSAQSLASILTNDLETTKIKVDDSFIQVKGVVKDAEGPLPGVSIILKGSTVGTSSNFKGEFDFPGEVNVGDVIVFSFLGYKTAEIIVASNTSLIELTMEAEDIDIFESLQTSRPYKSKRRSL